MHRGVKAAAAAKANICTSQGLRLHQLLPLATQTLHAKPLFPRVEILLPVQSLISRELFSRLRVLQIGEGGQRVRDERLFNPASPAELMAGGSVDGVLHYQHLKYL